MARPELFGVEDGIVAVIGATAAAVAVLGGGAGWFLKWLTDRQRTNVDEYKRIVDRLQKWGDRCQAQVDSQRAKIAKLVVRYAEMSAECQAQYGFMMLQNNMLQRQRDELIRAGKGAEEVPTLPDKPTRVRDDEIEYMRRDAEHQATVAQESRAAEDSTERERRERRQS